MYKLKFNDPIHIHFIGIGGISMSGLAEILLEKGFTISGSDAKESDLTRMLASKGAQIFYGQSAENIIPGIDLVVYTAAIHPDNPEFAEARSQGLPMLSRAELLGQIMRFFLLLNPIRPSLLAEFFPLSEETCVSVIPESLFRRPVNTPTVS